MRPAINSMRGVSGVLRLATIRCARTRTAILITELAEQKRAQRRTERSNSTSCYRSESSPSRMKLADTSDGDRFGCAYFNGKDGTRIRPRSPCGPAFGESGDSRYLGGLERSTVTANPRNAPATAAMPTLCQTDDTSWRRLMRVPKMAQAANKKMIRGQETRTVRSDLVIISEQSSWIRAKPSNHRHPHHRALGSRQIRLEVNPTDRRRRLPCRGYPQLVHSHRV